MTGGAGMLRLELISVDSELTSASYSFKNSFLSFVLALSFRRKEYFHVIT